MFYVEEFSIFLSTSILMQNSIILIQTITIIEANMKQMSSEAFKFLEIFRLF